jgi:hypothetical protein
MGPATKFAPPDLPSSNNEVRMKFMIEFRLKPGHKEQVLETFEKTGPNRHPGVTFRGAWVGSRSDVIFVLLESDEGESTVANLAESWKAHGEAKFHAVVDVDEV